MTPREQLIQAIADKRCRMASINPGGLPGQYEGARPKFAESADLTLQAISDLGAVVLMPVKEGQSVANVIVLNEKHVLRTTPEERGAGLFVNALEGEQS